MDPKAAWEALQGAVLLGEYEDAREHADALLGWLKIGGFPPPGVGFASALLVISRILKGLES